MHNTGQIIKHNRQQYHIWTGDQTITCTLPNRLQHELAVNLVVGDQIRWNDAAQIIEALPRNNWMSRRSAAPMPSAHP